MKKAQRDRAYWSDQFQNFYVDGNFGEYEEALERFVVAFPEFVEFVKQFSKERTEKEFQKTVIRELAQRFREADRHESAAAPMPVHLRDAFLPFHVDVPPMSQSVESPGNGRLSMLDATNRLHSRHQTKLKQFHRERFVYREANEARMLAFRADCKRLFPDVENIDDLPLRRIIELALERGLTVKDDDDDPTALPIITDAR